MRFVPVRQVFLTRGVSSTVGRECSGESGVIEQQLNCVQCVSCFISDLTHAVKNYLYRFEPQPSYTRLVVFVVDFRVAPFTTYIQYILNLYSPLAKEEAVT